MKKRLLWLLSGFLAGTALFSCAPPAGLPQAAAPTVSLDGIPTVSPGGIVTGGLRSGDAAIDRNSIDAILSNERPGLATGWGDERRSHVAFYDFTRAARKPAGMDTIHYNNKAGIAAMTNAPKKVEPMQTAAGGLIEWGVKGRSSFLPTFKEHGWGRRLVEGRPGAEYALVIRNRSRSRLEVVVSVDGLDVLDGKPASTSRRGYLINAGQTLEIEGFRTSSATVAAFKFSSVSNSYANLRHGDTRNVGVIGVAVFTEKGVDPWRTPEAIRRDQARPFAEAPVVRGRRW